MSETKQVKTNLGFKRTEMKFTDNKTYLWHKRVWSCEQILVGTYLSQQLTRYAIETGALTKEDFSNAKFDDPREVKPGKKPTK